VGLYEDMEGKFVCLCQKIVLKNFVVRLWTIVGLVGFCNNGYVKVEVKLPLCVTMYHTMKTYYT
jgi:hypothetical protein